VHSRVRGNQTFVANGGAYPVQLPPALGGGNVPIANLFAGYRGQSTVHSLSGESLVGSLFGGYGARISCKGYIGAEANFSLQSTDAKEIIDQNSALNLTNSIFSVSSREEFGISLRLGYEIVSHAMASLYLGFSNAKWTLQNQYPHPDMVGFAPTQYNYTTDSRRWGGVIGVGADFLMGSNTFVGLKMEWKKYQGLRAIHKGPVSDLATLSAQPSLYSFMIRFGYIF
jgi:hypothetical protein